MIENYVLQDMSGAEMDDLYRAMHECFDHPRGQMVLQHLKAQVGFNAPSYIPGVTARVEDAIFADGQKSVIMHIETIMNMDPEKVKKAEDSDV